MCHTLFHRFWQGFYIHLLLVVLTSMLPAWARLPPDPNLYLYISPTTQRYLQSQKQLYEHNTKRWHAHLKKYANQAHTIQREQLLGGLPTGTLILPNSIALDNEERQAIQHFVAKGGNLLGSGLIGSRNAQGEYVGLDFLQSTFHVQAHGFFPQTDDSFFMPFGDSPVTWPLPAGRRMPLLSAKDTVLRIKADHEASVGMDWSRSMDTQANGLMAYNEIGASRLVYFSFPDMAWPYNLDVQLVMDASLAWLRREPVAFKSAWPNGYLASHLIEMDTEDKFPTAVRLAEQLESEGLRGTFYCLTSEAARAPKLVQDLMKRGHEIAYHADVHFGFNGDSSGEQELRILFMKQQLQASLGERTVEATGFRAPTESYDATTELLLHKHGILHHAADESASEDRLPFFSDAGGKTSADKALVVLPRTQRDDINFQKLQFNQEMVSANLLYDLDLTVRSGAFSLLSVHSQNYVNGGLMLQPMKDYVQKAATYKDRLWIARGDEITTWWRKRERVNVAQKMRGSRLLISVQSPIDVPGLSVFVTLPHKNAVMRLADASNSALVRVKPIDAFRSALVFDKLASGQSLLNVTFDAD
ncbi:MAG: xylanase/chitin deacetylase [Comamonadaceae bacterium]|nr:MAG: xylanase/chitin deacetylase [Comamonadaceae bacterium]